ncbi:MAG: GNAT family N-acetyltransferase [Clostridiales bacterium]|nr:GNAT family N-acetyltransferase [Clostridiales bacterium]
MNNMDSKDISFKSLAGKTGLNLFDMKDMEKAIACNIDAYEGYRLYDVLFGKHNTPEVMRKLWISSLHTLSDTAMIVIDSEDINGMAFFIPPGYKGMPIMPYLKSGGLKMPLSTLYPQARYESFCMQMKKRHTGHNSWYLFDLVVRQEKQLQGVAKSMLVPFFNYLDETKQDIYLETHADKNVPFYKHFGFDVVETGYVPGSKLTHYGMLRRHK